MSVPATITTAAITERKSLAIQLTTVPTPTVGAGELLVANAAVAQNPVDWKQIAYDFALPEVYVPWLAVP